MKRQESRYTDYAVEDNKTLLTCLRAASLRHTYFPLSLATFKITLSTSLSLTLLTWMLWKRLPSILISKLGTTVYDSCG